MIRTDCPSCKTPLMAPDSYTGKKPSCPVCKAKVAAVAAPSQRHKAAATKPAPIAPKAKSLVDELLEDAQAAPVAAVKPDRPVTRKKPPRPSVEPSPMARRRSMPWGVIVATAGALVILAAGIYAYRFVSGRIHDKNRELVTRQLAAGMGRVKADFDTAETARTAAMALAGEEKYDAARAAFVDAAGAYTGVKSRLASLRANVSEWGREFPDAEEISKANQELKELSGSVEAVLESKAMEHGPKIGKEFVLYDGKWVSLQEKAELFEKRMKDLGMVFFQNEWITKAEFEKRQGRVLYKGKYYDKAEADRLKLQDAVIAAAIAAKRAKETIDEKKRADELLKKNEKYPPDGATWVIDDFEGPNRWRSMGWANPCDVAVVKRGDSNVLHVKLKAGKQDKWALNLKLGLDMTSRGRLRMQIAKTGKRNAALAIALDTNGFHESREQTMREGDNEVSFDLNAGNFKTEKSGWQHRVRLSGKNYVGQVFLLIYRGEEGQEFFIDNVLATK